MPRTVVLTDEQGALLDRLVAADAYENVEAVVEAALRLLLQAESDDEARIAAVAAAIEEGERDARAGRVTVLKTAEDRAAFVRSLGTRR